MKKLRRILGESAKTWPPSEEWLFALFSDRTKVWIDGTTTGRYIERGL